MSDALIRAAFESRLKAWAAAQTPPIPVAWENVPFNPPKTRYARAFVLPAPTVSLTLDRTHRQRKGVYQVTLVMPIGSGAGAAAALCASIDAAFPIGTLLTQGGLTVTLLTPFSPATAIQEPERFAVPVSAQYQADSI